MSDYNPQKLREIRATLNLKQDQMASQAGLSQRDISLLENGKKEFIPTRYMQFLNRAGINLNWLFSEDGADGDMQLAKSPIEQTTNASIGRGIFDKNTQNITSFRVPVVTRAQLTHYPLLCKEQAFLDQMPQILLPPDDLPAVPTRCFQLDDDSMADTLLPFDYLVGQYLESWRDRLRSGFLYVWVSGHDVFVRRFLSLEQDVLRLKGDHEGYPVQQLSLNQIQEVWQIRGRLSFQLPAHPNDLHKQLGHIRANLETIQERLDDK